jgi:hypothetical protein
VIDPDPGDGVAWDSVVDTALRLRDLMKAEGLAPWPKLTGGKGIPVTAPLDPVMPHDEAHRYTHRLVAALAERDPEQLVRHSDEVLAAFVGLAGRQALTGDTRLVGVRNRIAAALVRTTDEQASKERLRGWP